MEIIADLHIHSRFARATSKDLTIDNLVKWAKIKGLHLIGTGDFQHPKWNIEIKEKLEEDDNGILWLKNSRREPGTDIAFLWNTEISLMFSQGIKKKRAVHLLVFAPNGIVADKIIAYLGSKGRLDYDGRPIFGISCKQFVHDLKEIDDKIEIIPAHCLLPDDKVICNPSLKKISDVEEGDKVLTHAGEYKNVKEVLVNYYDGKIFTIKPYYFRESFLNVTDNHPILAIKTVKDCSYISGLCKSNSIAKGKHTCRKKHYENYKPQWIFAKDLEINDVLLYPRVKKIEDKGYIKISDFVNKENYRIKNDFLVPSVGRQDKVIKDKLEITADFCRLAGYYLAEGSFSKRKNCLIFSFAKHEEEYINDVIFLMDKIFGVKLAKKRERNGYDLHFYSKTIIDLFDNLFYENNSPRRAYSKIIPRWMINLFIDKQAELFKGWWRGDAGTTTSEILAHQMKIICLRLGVIPSIYKTTKEKFNNYNSKINGRKIIASHDIYLFNNLSFYEDKFNLLKEKEFKRFNTKLQRKHGWIDENYVYIPIKDIETQDYDGDVYNLEVEDDNTYVTPSAIVHNCMTPWFGIFGSDSGFDSLAECFEEEARHIYAMESGMSADPSMIWRLKEKINIVSFSDAHSFWPWRLGREATIFGLDKLTYDNVIKAIRNGEGLKATIETPPEYGKYHWDGHRNCNFSSSPEETKKINGICPVCKRGLTIGVENRIDTIAKEKEGFRPNSGKDFYKLLPLHELIGVLIGSKVESPKTWKIYNEVIEKFGNEFYVLLRASEKELLEKNVSRELVNLILLNRDGKLSVKPGYDGKYGEVLLPSGVKKAPGQKTLF